MTDQETPEGGALPSDANASRAEPTTDVEAAKPGSEADPSPAAKDSGDKATERDPRDDRIKELTRHRREAERRADRLMQAHQELLQRLGSQQQPAQQQPAAKPKTFAEL